MAAAGSISGNAVQRLEDPTLLTGAGKYLDDMAPLERCTSRSSALLRPMRPSWASTSPTARDDARREGRLPRSGQRSRNALLPGLPDDADHSSTGRSSPTTGPLRRRHRGRRRRRDRRRRPSTPPRPSSSTTTRCRPSSRRRRAWRPTPRSCSPSTARTSASAPNIGEDVDPSRRRRRDRRGHHGQPAPGRRADGEQRHPRRARRATGGLTCWISHQAPHSAHGAHRPACSAWSPSRLRVVCPWVGGGFGPKAAVYVEYLVAAAAALALGRAGEVGRDPLGGHGVARPRPRLRDDGQARRRTTTARSPASRPTSPPTPARTRPSAPSCRC